MDGVLTDLRFACNRLRRDAAFTLSAIAMLALGIGVSVAAFSVLKGVVLAGLPYPGGERVVAVSSLNPAQSNAVAGLTGAEAFRLADDPAPFERFGYYVWGGVTLHEEGEPREITINRVSGGLFATLGVRPLLGRWIDADDVAQDRRVVVLSHEEWQRTLGGAPDAVGRKLTLSDQPYEVVGVMPPEFRFPSSEVGLWTTALPQGFMPGTPVFLHARYLNGVGLLPQPGDPAAALERVAAAVRAEHGLPDQGWRMGAISLIDQLVGDVRWVLWAVFAIAVLVLVLSCSNVAILLDARLTGLRRELAVAQALGASPGRLRRTLILELAMVAVLALGAGTALAVLAVEGLRALAEGTVPRASGIAIDATVLGFALGLSALVPLLVGLAGGRVRAEPAEALRGAGRGSIAERQPFAQRWLPSGGVALSTVALVAATALAWSLTRLAAVEPGFRAADVHALQLFRSGNPAEWRRFGAALAAEIDALPGVDGVALTTNAPLSLIGSFGIDVKRPDRDQSEPLQVDLRRVSPEYLGLLEIPLKRGRGIGAEDREGTELVAVINETLAKAVYGAEDPLGRVLQLPLGNGPLIDYRVVGVIADTRNDGLRSGAAPELLVPFAQTPWVGMTLLARSNLPVATLQQQVREALWRVDPREAVTRQFTLAEDLETELKPVAFFVRVVGGFAALALALAAFGVYSVASYRQRRRVPEFGVRLALGAPPARILALVLGESLPAATLGVLAGLVGAMFALKLLAAQLFGFDGTAAWPAYLAGVLAMLLAVLAASLAPAWRASRTDPMTALRYE